MNINNSESFFIIANKFSGHGYAVKAVNFLLKYFNEKGIVYRYEYTLSRGHATVLAGQASEQGYRVVVAVGGDGTVNEVATGLLGSKTKLGIIPVGSGNGLARDLKIPMRLKGSIETLMLGNIFKIDVCRLNAQEFFCTSGIGFDALVAHKISLSKTRGFIKYIQLVIQESIFFKPLKVNITIDNINIIREVFLVTFSNAAQFGNNAFIAPQASASDGIIDVVIVNKFNKLLMPVFSIALFTGLVPKLPFVEYFKAKKIQIREADTTYFHFDGEPGDLELPTKIEFVDYKLKVICGKNYNK